MQDTDLAIQELQRCKKELGLSGIELGTNINGINLSDSQFFPLYAEAEALDIPLFIHPWDMMGEDQIQKYWLPWLVGMPAETSRAICSVIFGGVLEKFPKLRIAFAHGGGSFPATLGRVQHGFDVRPDLVAIDNPVPPVEYVGKFWIDSLVHDARALRFIIDVMGENQICLGSDYPFPLGELHPGKLIDAVINNSDTKQKLFSQNAYRWLGGKYLSKIG
jgi:aminocarboxymuconate-semialdehyde decarboxylase